VIGITKGRFRRASGCGGMPQPDAQAIFGVSAGRSAWRDGNDGPDDFRGL
jgi:hypothetical protein